jgi:tetratricopeptide (TPR) repeat protein
MRACYKYIHRELLILYTFHVMAGGGKMNSILKTDRVCDYFFIAAILVIFLGVLVAPTSTQADQSSVVKAENAFFRGSHLLSRDNIAEALPALEEAVNLDPSVPKYKRVLAIAYNNYGIKLGREGRPLDGLRSMEKAMSVEPTDSELKGNFVSAVLQAVAGQSDKLKMEDRIYYVQKILEIEPQNVSAKKAMAAFLNNQGINHAKGIVSSSEIEALNSALEMDPTNQKIKKNLGMAYHNLALQKGKENSFEEQIDLLRKAESYLPKDSVTRDSLARALSNLAVIKGKEGKIDEQIGLLKESMELLPNDAAVK